MKLKLWAFMKVFLKWLYYCDGIQENNNKNNLFWEELQFGPCFLRLGSSGGRQVGVFGVKPGQGELFQDCKKKLCIYLFILRPEQFLTSTMFCWKDRRKGKKKRLLCRSQHCFISMLFFFFLVFFFQSWQTVALLPVLKCVSGTWKCNLLTQRKKNVIGADPPVR